MAETKIDPAVQDALDILNKRMDGLEKSIEIAAKTANDAAESAIVEKKPEAKKPPVEFSIGKKSYRAKGNKYLTKGGVEEVDLSKLSDADLKQAYEETPSMFVEV